MRIVLVDVPQRLLAPLTDALAADHEVIITSDPTRIASIDCPVIVQGYRTDRRPEEMIMDATYGSWQLLTGARAQRYIQLTSTAVFDAYDPGWSIDEQWLPRPTTDATQLAPYLAEIASREISRARDIQVRVLRLDHRDLVPISDVVSAIVGAIGSDPLPGAAGRWQVLHVTAGGRRPTGTPAWPTEPEPITGLPAPRAITMFGAGGPLGVAAVRAIIGRADAPAPTLAVTDHRPIAELAAGPPQSPGAPQPAPLSAPHRQLLADVTDPSAVVRAAAGADTLINCSVVRTEPAGAFAVNTLGAYTIMRAAADAGIRRVVQTGPAQVLHPHPIGYLEDRLVSELAPARAGDRLYFLTKLLAQEICRTFAIEHRIACPVLLFCALLDPDLPRERPLHPFAVSWADAGRAVAAAARVNSLPEPAPLVHIHAPSPHGRYTAERAGRILGWQAEDRLDRFWQ